MESRTKKSKLVAGASAVVALVLAVSLAACGSATLQDYVTNDDLQALANQAAVEGTTVRTNVRDNDFSVEYQLDSLDSPWLDSFMSGYYGAIDWDAVYASMQGNVEPAIAQLEKKTGIDGVTCTVSFRDSSGKVLSQHTFTD